MGEHTRVDTAAVRAAADRFDDTADILDTTVRTQLSRLGFDGAAAGRAYTAEGDALRRALDRLAGPLSQWSRASAEIAMALRVSVDHYADADLRCSAGIG